MGSVMEHGVCKTTTKALSWSIGSAMEHWIGHGQS
jgi:hypothetical protein